MKRGVSIIDEFGLIALLGLGPSLKHGLGSLLSLLLLPALHGLDHGDLFGLLLLVPRLKQQPGVKRRRGGQTIKIEMPLHAFILAGPVLPVFDYPLYDGISGEAVPAVHDPQDSSPPGLLDVNKTGPNENGSDCRNGSEVLGGVGWFLQRTGRIHPCPDRFLSSHDKQDPPVIEKNPLLLRSFLKPNVFAVFRRFHLL